MDNSKQNPNPFQNKKYAYLVIGLAIVVLAVVTIWQPGQLGFHDSTNYDAKNKAAQKELEEYQKLLASIEPNYAASQQLLQKIVTSDVVKQEVEDTLQTKQPIIIPQIANSEIKITNRKDADAVVNYLSQVNSMVENYRSASQTGVDNLFADSSSPTELNKAAQSTTALVDNFKKMEVPSPAAEVHKANLVAFKEYGEIFETAKKYSEDSSYDPWPNFYQNYAVIDNRVAVVKSGLETLGKQYASLNPENLQPQNPFVKTAQAQFVTTTIVTADLERQIIEGVKAGLAKSFAQFSIKMLDKLVSHIEKNFAIASQLYYSNDLGRYYSVEYMKKFVADPLDQDIIQKFLPEYFCVSPDKKKLNEIFTAKARQNAGSDLIINPSDPDFLQKLTRLGSDEKNYPVWWEGYYESLATKTKAEAESAATKEVISPGFKSGRDLITGQVNKTVAAIFNTQEAAITGVISLGTNNASSPISATVAGVVENLTNKFIFTPITGGNSGSGGISVIQEQDVCLQVPQVKPLIPVPTSEYTNDKGETTTTPYVTPPFNPRN
jgi:hypothetical protein